jgi:PAS domain S-box-containing protein
MPRFFSTRTYIALGLASIVSTALLASSFFGLIPDRVAAQRDGRLALVEAAAAGSTALLSSNDPRSVEALLRFVVNRNDQLLSVALRADDGKVPLSIGDHLSQWVPPETGRSASGQISVPVFARSQPWGQLEFRFKPLSSVGIWGILENPVLQLIAFCSTLSMFGFLVYLNRVLRHLDPSKAIPARVRSALDSLTEGLLVVDQKRNIVLANEAFVKLVGQSNEQLMGKSTASIAWLDATGASLTVSQQPWETALETGQVQQGSVLSLVGQDGGNRTFVVNCSPVLGSAGRPGGVLISLEDITLLEESKIQLQGARDEAEAANRAKSEFLANMSHEIRTPMNALLGFTELLKRGYSKSERESTRYLNTIHSSGKHLLELINDILDLSKVESGHLEIEKLACAPHAVVAQAVAELAVKAAEKGITITVEGRGLLPSSAESDPARMRQIVLNLLSNAVKFTDKGGVKVLLACLETQGEAIYTVEVHDSGIGMRADQLESMFEPFRQADASINRKYGGTGLGLTISRRFARAMGGDIHAASQPGQGSVMTLTFNVGRLVGVDWRQFEDLMMAVDSDKKGVDVRWNIPSSKILVVDDGVENRELITLVLAEQGLWVEEAENGQQALDKIEQSAFDLVLMDMQMPVLDGFTATRMLRQRGVSIPIVALTANAMVGFEQQILEIGCTAYLTKPLDIDVLLEKLAQLLGGSRADTVVATEFESRVDSLHADVVSVPALEPLPAPTTPITSRLADNLRFAPIVRKFASRLDEMFIPAEQALALGDVAQVGTFGHWLAGAAGTMGYDAFTGPARELEQFALAGDNAGMNLMMVRLREMAGRIELPVEVSSSIPPAPDNPEKEIHS